MTRPRILDLFCGAGGAAMGYHRAGFDVVGVDITPQPHYPFTFVQMDAIEFLTRGGWVRFDAIHASPPCQAYSTMTKKWGRSAQHPDLVEPVRDRLRSTGLPYVIENVVGAPLVNPVRLCGSSFGLPIQRHRLFEMSDPPMLVPPCQHNGPALQVNGHPGGSSRRDPKARFGSTEEWRAGMGIGWMSAPELAEAIPPAYTEWIGQHLLDVLASPKADPVRPAWGRADVGRPSGTRERPSPSSGGGFGRRAPRRRRAGSTPSRPATP